MRLFFSIGKLLNKYNIRGGLSGRDREEKFDLIVEANDQLLEKIVSFRGLCSILCYFTGNDSASNSSVSWYVIFLFNCLTRVSSDVRMSSK